MYLVLVTFERTTSWQSSLQTSSSTTMTVLRLVPDNTNQAWCRRISGSGGSGGGLSSETNKTATLAKEKQQVKERRPLAPRLAAVAATAIVVRFTLSESSEGCWHQQHWFAERSNGNEQARKGPSINDVAHFSWLFDTSLPHITSFLQLRKHQNFLKYMDGPQARRRRRRQRRWCGSIPPTPQVRSTLPLCTHTALQCRLYTITQLPSEELLPPPPRHRRWPLLFVAPTVSRWMEAQAADDRTFLWTTQARRRTKSVAVCRRIATVDLCTAPPRLAAAAVTPYLLYHDDGWMDERSM